MAQLKVTQVRSIIRQTKTHRLTLKALGLRRMHQSVVVPDNAQVRGMVKSVQHLVNVQEVAA